MARLTHGLEPLRHLRVAAGPCSVAQDPAGGRFVVLDGAGHLHVHREDGWADKKLRAPAMLTGLVAMRGPRDTTSRFVGWGPEGLAILRPDLSLLWLSEPGVGRGPGHEPICGLPVPSLGLLLVAEAGGSLVLWEFRSGGSPPGAAWVTSAAATKSCRDTHPFGSGAPTFPPSPMLLRGLRLSRAHLRSAHLGSRRRAPRPAQNVRGT